MPQYLKISFFGIVFLLLNSFCFVDNSLATSISWQRTFNYTGKSGYIKFSSAKTDAVFAAVDRPGSYDILYSINNGNHWTSIKSNLPPSGDINWISDLPGDEDIIAISLWGSGIYLTENGGAYWTKIFDSSTPRTVQIDPENLDTIFVGVGGGTSQSGIYKTVDKGVTWNKVTGLSSGNVAQISIDPNDHLRIFADVDPNFYRSDDGGNTWTLLPLQNVYTTGTIIDSANSAVIYTGSFQSPSGIYKSTDNGNSWIHKGIPEGVFHISQDADGSILSTSFLSSGLWLSLNGAETWEDVSDPEWNGANTWGIDYNNDHAVVSVDGLGLFIATISASTIPTPTPIPGPNPVVVIPGFGGSFSAKGLILHQPTTYEDWTIMPVRAPGIYEPFLNSLKTLSYLQDNKVFFFPYDFTRSIATSGQWLDDYLENEVLSNNPGKKVDVVGHSMGGLVARYCFESVPGCKDKINKIISAGAPHKGAVADYHFWEGAEFGTLDPLAKYAAKLMIHINGFPKTNEVEIIQQNIPGARDFLPTFDYIVGKPYSSLSSLAKNPVLENLPFSSDYAGRTLALSGDRQKSTLSELTVKTPKQKDLDSGYWVDGEPHKSEDSIGDGTVLQLSSLVPGATNKSYKIDHDQYLNTNQPVTDILQFLGISPIGPLSAVVNTEQATMYYSRDSNMTLSIEAAQGERVLQPDPNVVFVLGGKPTKTKISVYSEKGGNFEIKGLYSDRESNFIDVKPVKVSLKDGEWKTVESGF